MEGGERRAQWGVGLGAVRAVRKDVRGSLNLTSAGSNKGCVHLIHPTFSFMACCLPPVRLGQRGDLHRVLRHKRWLHQLLLH